MASCSDLIGNVKSPCSNSRLHSLRPQDGKVSDFDRKPAVLNRGDKVFLLPNETRLNMVSEKYSFNTSGRELSATWDVLFGILPVQDTCTKRNKHPRELFSVPSLPRNDSVVKSLSHVKSHR